MTKKRFTALILVFAMVFTMTACRNTENLHGDTESKDALRICIDVGGYSGDDDPQKMRDIDDFMLSLKQSGGLENIVFEVIPSNGVDRSTVIARIRTEIMAGGGPDVFIVDSSYNLDIHRAVFPFPEKCMETGLFLPLDEYMEKNTEFTEWDKQQPVVLAAGRNEEGQQIIPLTYTFPVQTCLEDAYAMETPDEPLTWQDTLTDPEYSAVYAEFNDCTEIFYDYNMNGEKVLAQLTKQYLEHILGRLADFEEEELLFTEEELLQRINEILALQESNNYEDETVFTDELMNSSMVNSVLPVTMMQMYSDDGGITVSIGNFAAVNRNTKHPEEAYRVIDILLRSHTQLTKGLYTNGFCSQGSLTSIPLYDETFHKDAPFNFRFFQKNHMKRLHELRGRSQRRISEVLCHMT